MTASLLLALLGESGDEAQITPRQKNQPASGHLHKVKVSRIGVRCVRWWPAFGAPFKRECRVIPRS
jgi:hypothetical protein